jgi:BMFP domain-containing protein YqiC
MMTLPHFQLDEITKKLLNLLPISAHDIKEDLEEKVKLILQSSLSKLDMVSREEFDIQTQVLAKTRAKLEALEKQLEIIINQKNK